MRRRALAALLAEAGHAMVADAPDAISPAAVLFDAVLFDAVLFDRGPDDPWPLAGGAPVLLLGDRRPSAFASGGSPAGALPRGASGEWIDLALRAVAAGLTVRAPMPSVRRGFAAADEESPLTPRETEILTLVGQGLGNKAVARHLGISVRTVKFHLESLFGRLGVTNRAGAVARGLTGGAIEL